MFEVRAALESAAVYRLEHSFKVRMYVRMCCNSEIVLYLLSLGHVVTVLCSVHVTYYWHTVHIYRNH